MPDTGPFSRWDTSGWTVEDEEPGGAVPKLWLRDERDRRWLFKPVKIHQNGHRQGEDWSEKAAAELAAHLSVPCARVELAARGGLEGSISLNVRPADYDMHSGATFLSAIGAPRFRPARDLIDERHPARNRRPGHSLENIRTALDGFGPPPDSQLPGGLDAFDVFVGYLVLDALIANQDRHDENWSVLLPTAGAGPCSISPSYDQGAGLGFNLTDARRVELLEGRSVGLSGYAGRGVALRFENEPGEVPTLVRHAGDALAAASEAGRSHWLGHLERLPDHAIESIFDRLTCMSDPERRFSRELLQTNAERLRDECRNRHWL